MSDPVFRFAPSPNGALHLGHAYSALLNVRCAAAVCGRLLLRVEDIDRERCTPALENGIYDDLAWLGIDWELPVRRQSDHFDVYRDALERLVAIGVVYPAFMSRAEMRAHIVEREAGGEIWPRDPDGVPLYPAVEKTMPHRQRATLLDSGGAYAWRLDMAAALERVGSTIEWSEVSGETLSDTVVHHGDPHAWGDVIVARRDVPTSYHLSVVVDDALQHVSHVVRGQDLMAATAVHRVLQKLLALPAPAYHHHRLILGPDGRKLSKSNHDVGIAALREAGETPADVRRRVGPE